MLQSYGMSSYIKIDNTKSHKIQECTMSSNGGTWFDFFLSMTIDEVTRLLSCAEVAKAEGITLDDEDLAAIEQEMANLESTAKSLKYSLKDYIKAFYGPSVTEDVVRDCVELNAIYEKYIETHVDAADTSDEAVEKLYTDAKETYDIVNYLSFTFDYNDLYMDEEEQKKAETATDTTATTTELKDGETTASTTDEPEEEPREAYSTTDRDEAVKKSRIDAGEFKAALDAASTLEERTKIFEDFVKDYLTDEFGLTDKEYEEAKDSIEVTATYKKSDDVLVWAFGEDVKVGDVKMFTETESHDHKEGDDHSELADVYTVVLLTETAHRDESLATADVRHILFSKSDYTDDVKAKEIYEQLKAVLGTDEFTAKFEE